MIKQMVDTYSAIRSQAAADPSTDNQQPKMPAPQADRNFFGGGSKLPDIPFEMMPKSSAAGSLQSPEIPESPTASLEALLEQLQALIAMLTGEEAPESVPAQAPAGEAAPSGGDGDARRKSRADGSSEAEKAGAERRANRGGKSDSAGGGADAAGVGGASGPMLDGAPVPGGGVSADSTDIRGSKGDAYHYKKEGDSEVFTISNTDKTGGSVNGENLDPRSEAKFANQKFKNGEEKSFTGKFTVEQGDNTTIAQIINSTPNSGDQHVPSAFVTYKDGALYQGNADSGKKIANVAQGEEFELSMKSNGANTDIYVNGEVVGNAEGRTSGENIFKYGAYHHGGKKDLGTENTAVIRARDVSVS